MLASVILFLAGSGTNSFSLPTCLKKFYVFFLVGLFVSSPVPALANTFRTLHLEWSYNTSLPGLAGYRFYHNGAFFGEIDNASYLAADLDVWLTDGTNSFTLTAFDVDGNESAPSAPFLVDNTSPSFSRALTAVNPAVLLLLLGG